MRLLSASLSLLLLLLALCRQSSSSVVSWTGIKTQSSIAHTSAAKTPEVKAKFAKVGEETYEEKLGNLIDDMGNALFALAMGSAGVKMPKFLDDAIDNGIMCEMNKAGLAASIKKALNYDDNVHKKELEILKGPKFDKNFRTDCTALKGGDYQKEEDCICKDNHPYFFCIYYQFERLGKVHDFKLKTCRAEALTALQTAAPNLHELYSDSTKLNNAEFEALFSGAGDIDKITKNAEDKMAKVLCEATQPKVKAAVKALYASDGRYWFVEALLYTLLLGPTEQDLETTCTNDSAFKDSKYGKCVCDKDTGFTFCIYNVLGDYFVEQKFLDCPTDATTAKFDATKKPTTLPQLAKPAPKPATAASTAAPGSGEGSKGDKGSATGSFSLLGAAAAAAAAALLA